MTNEFYEDERPPQKPGSDSYKNYWGSGPSTSGGAPHPEVSGGWGGGGGGGSGGGDYFPPPPYDGEDEDQEEPWFTLGSLWGIGFPLPLCDGNDFLLMQGLYILESEGGCIDVYLQCQFKNAENSNHARCLVISYVAYDDKGKKNAWIPGDEADGKIEIYVKWQRGHHDYNEINSVRFRLKHDEKNVSPWYRLPLGGSGKGKKIMTLKASLGILSIESFG